MILTLTRDVRDPRLQLHIRPDVAVRQAVIGWTDGVAPIDAGPPPLIVDLFADALVRVGTVLFLASPPARLPRDRWDRVDGDRWLRVATGLFQPAIALIATVDAGRASELFSSIAHWTAQSQVCFVVRGAELPVLPRRLVERVAVARDVAIESLDLPDAVRALVLPTVDGDDLELVARDDQTFEDLTRAIAAAGRRRDIELRGPWPLVA